MSKALIKDIDALDESNKSDIRIFQKDMALTRLRVFDHIKLSSIDQRLEKVNVLDPEELITLDADIKTIASKLVPEITEEEIEELTFDQYVWIREAVDERMMMDRGISQKDIEKIKKSQQKKALDL